MNIFDQELFDQIVSNFEASLKKVDEFYPNEKSLAKYFDAMANKPLEEWKRFEPIKGDLERNALQNLSHFGAALLTMYTEVYIYTESIEAASIELLEENKRLQDKINDLKVSERFWRCAYQDSNDMSMNIDKLFLSKIMA